MRSVLFASILGLVGAALLHIIIVLVLPQFTVATPIRAFSVFSRWTASFL